jgi:O-6-methylguanine DNA methyltransferase
MDFISLPELPPPFAKTVWRIEFSAKRLRGLSILPSSVHPRRLSSQVRDPRVQSLLEKLRARLAGKPVDIPWKEFDLSGLPAFFVRVWKAMHAIPRGELRTYAQLAAAAGSPRACRACGQACATNPIVVFIPCHRVISAAGLGGFSCGLVYKKALLRLEGLDPQHPQQSIMCQ